MTRSRYSIVVGLACVVGIAAMAPRSVASRGAITIHVGDTILPQYAIRTDTVLAVRTFTDPVTNSVHGLVVAQRCGVSQFFLRLHPRVGGVVQSALAGDTVTVTVTGCGTSTPPATNTANVGVCFLDPTLAESLHVAGDTTIDPSKLPDGACASGGTLQMPAIRNGHTQ